jgi:hypothetical protein
MAGTESDRLHYKPGCKVELLRRVSQFSPLVPPLAFTAGVTWLAYNGKP